MNTNINLHGICKITAKLESSENFKWIAFEFLNDKGDRCTLAAHCKDWISIEGADFVNQVTEQA